MTTTYPLLDDAGRAIANYRAGPAEILTDLDIADPDEPDCKAQRIARYRRGGQPAIIADLAALARWDLAHGTLTTAIEQLPIPIVPNDHPEATASDAALHYRDEARSTFETWRRTIHDAALLALLFPAGQTDTPRHLALVS